MSWSNMPPLAIDQWNMCQLSMKEPLIMYFLVLEKMNPPVPESLDLQDRLV